jgi:hypothetical protein
MVLRCTGDAVLIACIVCATSGAVLFHWRFSSHA